MSRFTSIFLLGVLLLSLTTSVFSHNKLVVYDALEGSLLNNNFSVQERQVKNITFENLKINGIYIHDNMEGKPAWYKTSDMTHFFVGEHVEGLSFKLTK